MLRRNAGKPCVLRHTRAHVRKHRERVDPYVLNSIGNCLNSLGRWEGEAGWADTVELGVCTVSFSGLVQVQGLLQWSSGRWRVWLRERLRMRVRKVRVAPKHGSTSHLSHPWPPLTNPSLPLLESFPESLRGARRLPGLVRDLSARRGLPRPRRVHEPAPGRWGRGFGCDVEKLELEEWLYVAISL
jgi:hypothetical protein